MGQTLSSIFAERNFQPNTSWRWWTSLAVGLAILLISFVASMLAILAATTESATAEQLASNNFPEVPSTAIVACVIITQALMLGGLILVSRRGGAPWAERLHLGDWSPDRKQLVAIVMAVSICLLLSFAWSMIHPEADASDSAVFQEMLIDSKSRLAAIIALTIGAPLSEELLFRGFLLPPLARTKIGFSGAAISTTLLWAAMHFYSWQGFVMLIVTGLFLSYLLWRTGSLWPSIAMHALMNAVFALLAIAL